MMGSRVKDKVTVITGAACGIGAGAARLFVEPCGGATQSGPRAHLCR